jgi:CubicO group peptidase (beta-lactamase class C family)
MAEEMSRLGTRLVSAAVDSLRQIDAWPAEHAAAGVLRGGETVATRGATDREFGWASVTKPATALAVLVAAEEGILDLDEPAGPAGSTVRHLLAHASGLPFEGREPIGPPGKRRTYSNSGFDVLGEVVAERAEMPYADYLLEAVLAPLGMRAELGDGRPGSGLVGSIDDLLRLGRELQRPTLIAPETLAEATSVQFPGLAGVIPDLGRFDPNDWGLGLELRDEKPGHFSGTRTSPRTFGHWGGSGTFLWVDPEADLALGVLTDLGFGDWAKEAWPHLSDAVYTEASGEL